MTYVCLYLKAECPCTFTNYIRNIIIKIKINTRIQPYELRMYSSGRLDMCTETAINEPVCLATAVSKLVLQAVFL